MYRLHESGVFTDSAVIGEWRLLNLSSQNKHHTINDPVDLMLTLNVTSHFTIYRNDNE